MAGLFQSHDLRAQEHFSSGPSNHIPSRGETPVSFRTNVNRAKTKRWIEAKQYSYDGDDWGEDEYNEYDSSMPPIPQPLSLAQINDSTSGLNSKNPLRPLPWSSSRSRSTDQLATDYFEGSRGSRSHSADRSDENASSRTLDAKTLPFVRPVDIYKRMPQCGLVRDVPQELGCTDEVQQGSAAKLSSLPSHGGVADADRHGPRHDPDSIIDGKLRSGKDTGSPACDTESAPVAGPQDAKKIPSFSTDILDQSDSCSSSTATVDSQRFGNDSYGLKSTVHQTFVAIETRDSAAGVASRSNSDSTSTISPIIKHHLAGQKSPVITEEPRQLELTLTEAPLNIPVKPVDRWDTSLSDSDNNLQKRPEINDGEPHPESVSAEISSTYSHGYFQLNQPAVEPFCLLHQSSHASEQPIQFRSASGTATEHCDLKPHGSATTRSIATENTHENTENDRLREEIIRSLSREDSPADGAAGSRPEIYHDSHFNPVTPATYWNNESGHVVDQLPRFETQSDASVSQNAPHERLPNASCPAAAATIVQSKSKLTRRFSWESSSSDEELPTRDLQPAELQATAFNRQPFLPPDGKIQLDSASAADEAMRGKESNAFGDRLLTERPSFNVTPPSVIDEDDMAGQCLPEVWNNQAPHDVPPSNDSDSAIRTLVPLIARPPSTEPSLPGFRDILGMQLSGDRVQSFNQARDQFAAIDTGLNHWIRVTVNAYPEHMDTVERSLKLTGDAPRPFPSKVKFPKLPSLGNLTTSGPPGSLHVRRPSTHLMNRQQVEQRGKDLLHSAGVLGGRAGGAAKGLFTKGKSKLSLGGVDKADA